MWTLRVRNGSSVWNPRVLSAARCTNRRIRVEEGGALQHSVPEPRETPSQICPRRPTPHLTLINKDWFPRQTSSPEFCCPSHGLGVPPSPRAAPGPTFHPSWGGYSSLCVGMTWKDIAPRSHLPQKNMSSWNPGRTWCGPQGNSCRSPQEQVSRVK